MTTGAKPGNIIRPYRGSTIPCSLTRVTKDWWRMTSLQKYLKAFCFYFACLMSALLCQLQFVCFFSGKTPHHHWNNTELRELEGFRDSWLNVTTHSKTQTLFCTDTRSSSLGVAETGTLKLDLRAWKSQNTIFFLEYLFTHYRATITIETLLAV